MKAILPCRHPGFSISEEEAVDLWPNINMSKTDFYWDLALVVALMGISLICFMKFLFGPLAFDEEFNVWGGWSILNHEVPYRDFIVNKPPLIYFVNALGIILFGLENYHFKWMSFIFICLAELLFFFSLRRFRIHKIFSFLIVLNFIYLIFNSSFHDGTLNDTETYGLVFSIIAFSLINWNVRDGRKHVNLMKFLGGAFAALAVASKEPFLLVVAPMIAVNYVFESKNSVAQKNKRLLMIFIGAGLVVFATFCYLFLRGALIPYFTAVKGNIIYSKYYAQDLGIFINKSFWSSMKFDVLKLCDGYSGGAYFFALIPFYLAFLWRWKWSFFTMLNILGIILGAYAVSMGHCFWLHYFVIGIFSFIQPAVYGAVYISDVLRKHSFISGVFFTIFAVSLSAYQTVPMIKADMQMSRMGNDFTVPAELKIAVDKYTSKDDFILVTTQPYYYVTLDRRPSYRRGVMIDEFTRAYDGVTEEEKLRLMKLEIEKMLPKVIYLDRSWLFPRQQKHLNQVVNPLIEEHGYIEVNEGVFVLPPV